MSTLRPIAHPGPISRLGLSRVVITRAGKRPFYLKTNYLNARYLHQCFPMGLLTLTFDRATLPFLNIDMQHKAYGRTILVTRHGLFLKCKMRYKIISKLSWNLQKQRQGKLPFLKVDIQHWGPPVKGPSHRPR